MQLADTLIALSGGRIIAHGPIDEMLARNEVQSIIGRFESAALINATVLGHDTIFHLTELDCTGTIIKMPYVNLQIGSQVRVRIRARDVALATKKPDGTSFQNILAGKIVEIVEETDTAFAETLVDIGGTRLRARVTRKSVAEMELEVGREVYALVKSVSFDRRALA